MVLKTIILPILLTLAGIFMMLNCLAEETEAHENKVLYGVMACFFFTLLLLSTKL